MDFSDLTKWIDIGLSLVFIVVFSKVILHLYNETKRLNKLLTVKIEEHANNLQKRDDDNNKNNDRLAKSLDMLTTALINGFGIRTQGNQRREDNSNESRD